MWMEIISLMIKLTSLKCMCASNRIYQNIGYHWIQKWQESEGNQIAFHIYSSSESCDETHSLNYDKNLKYCLMKKHKNSKEEINLRDRGILDHQPTEMKYL